MPEEVARGRGEILVLCLLAAEWSQGKLVDGHSQSWPAVKDGETGTLMLIGSW